MKSGHDKISGILPEYVGNSLPPDSKGEVEAHLAVCEECRETVALIGGLLDVGIPDPGEFFWTTLPRKVTASKVEKESGGFAPKYSLWRPLSAAAAAVLIIAVIVYTKNDRRAPLYEDLQGEYYSAADLFEDNGLDEQTLYDATVREIGEDLSERPDDLSEYSYHRDVAYLSAKESEYLYEALKKDEGRGG